MKSGKPPINTHLGPISKLGAIAIVLGLVYMAFNGWIWVGLLGIVFLRLIDLWGAIRAKRVNDRNLSQ